MLVRQIFRTLMRDLPSYKFSTAPPGAAPSFKFPRRWDLKVLENIEVYNSIESLTQVSQFATLLKDNLGRFTDQHIGFLHQKLQKVDLELDNNFYDIILPITKQYIKKFTIQEADSLAVIIKSCLFYQVNDEELWDLVLGKLHNERIYRYISLPDTLTIAQQLYLNPRLNSHRVLEDFAQVLGQQTSFYQMYSPIEATQAARLSEQITKLVKSRQPERKLLQSEVKKISQS